MTTKLETCSDGATRRRYCPHPGQGGPKVAVTTRQTLALAMREFEVGRRELLDAVDALDTPLSASARREAVSSRRSALERLLLAGRLLVDLARSGQESGPGDDAAREATDVAPHTVSQVASAARPGAKLYVALERPRWRELASDLERRIVARGLVLVTLSPGWYEVASGPATVRPCSACGGEVRHARCRRCGTRA